MCVLLHKGVFDKEIIAARTAQTGRVPCIENFALRHFDHALTSFRYAIGIHHWRSVQHDDASQPDPLAMVTSAGEGKPTANLIAAGHPSCLPGRCGSR